MDVPMKVHHTTKCSSAPIQNCIGNGWIGGCLATRVPLEISTGAPPAPLKYVRAVKQLFVRLGLRSHSRVCRSCEPVLTSVHFCGLGDLVIILLLVETVKNLQPRRIFFLTVVCVLLYSMTHPADAPW